MLTASRAAVALTSDDRQSMTVGRTTHVVLRNREEEGASALSRQRRHYGREGANAARSVRASLGSKWPWLLLVEISRLLHFIMLDATKGCVR